MSVSLVESGSSPLSLRMAQEASVLSRRISSTARCRAMPFGVCRSMVSFFLPLKSMKVAAFAAAAAQEPVV